MSSMIQGVYSEIVNLYTTESWVIWLEEFSSNSIISITDECNHIFHTFRLKDWYLSIDFHRPPWWPICKTTNKFNLSRVESTIQSVTLHTQII